MRANDEKLKRRKKRGAEKGETEEREKGEVVYIVYSFMLIKLSLLHSIVINKIYEIL